MLSEKEIAEEFGKGFDCAAVVLSELSDKIGITKKEAYRISACFGAGMMQGGVCGAVTGAFMAIGIKYGNCEPNDSDQKNLCMQKRQEFVDRFEKEFKGTVVCPELIKLDVRKEDEFKKAQDTGVLTEVCPVFVKRAIEIARELL